MALKQSHVNQLHKIIASAEKLIKAITHEIKSGDEKSTRNAKKSARGASKTGARGGVKSSGKKTGKAQSKRARGRQTAGGRKAGSGEASGNAGNRRNRAQTAEFRQSILKELEGGAPVADLAAKHGITPAYIYQIKSRAEAG